MSRPSDEIVFKLHYSYHIEILTNIFFLRATRFLWLIQLITGCVIIANFLPALFSGLLIVLSTYLLGVYRTTVWPQKPRFRRAGITILSVG